MMSLIDHVTTTPAAHSNHTSVKSSLAIAGVLFAIIAILVAARSGHYLLFHTLTEIFAIVVSLSIFILTWASNRYLANGYLIVLGGAYGAIGLVDVFHSVTFRGMNIFPGISSNYPTQFWLTARYLEAIALLWAPLAVSRKPNFLFVSAGFSMLAALASAAVVFQWFPATFIDGVGLTPFKVYSEYTIIAILIAGSVLLYRAKSHFEQRIFFLLAASIGLAIATEFCFARYVGFFDFSNELGHYIRFVSVAFAFIAVVLSGIRQPFDLIFRELEADKRELRELNEKLAESEDRFKRIFNEAPLGIALIDSLTGYIYSVNPMFAKIAGRTMEEMTHIDWMSITHPDDVQCDLDNMALLNAGKISGFQMEKRYLHHDGAVVWINMTIAPVYVDDKAHPRHLCMIEDITGRKKTDQALRASLAEKEVMMREIHHRVKNNLQMMSALLELQSGYVKDAQVLGYFKDSQQRIQSMAMVHEQLYHNENIAQIDFAAYLRSLVDNLRGQYSERCKQVNIQVNAQACILPVDTAIPCGLVVTELVSNAMKHAFPGGRCGELHIGLQTGAEGKVVLEVTDNGVGLPAEPNLQSGKGFGMRIIKLMVEEQLHGKLSIESNHGTRVVCEIGMPK